jgi:hypothetical protein
VYIILQKYVGLQVKHKKCQNGLKKSNKHVFLYDYFVYMWLASKVRNCELNEYETSQMI